MIMKGRKKLMLELGINPKGEFLFMNDKSPYINIVKATLEIKKLEYNELVQEAKNFQEYPTYTKKRAVLFRRIYYVENDVKELERFIERYKQDIAYKNHYGKLMDHSKEALAIPFDISNIKV